MSLYDINCGLSSGTNEVGHEREWVIIGKLMSITIAAGGSTAEIKISTIIKIITIIIIIIILIISIVVTIIIIIITTLSGI